MQTLTWTDELASVDWLALQAFYAAVPLGNKPAELLQTCFGNSRYRWLVRDGAGQIVGAGRVLSDGADCAYLCDVAVLPSHQGTGLGQAIVQRLVEQCRGHRKIILYAVPGKEGFYRRLGFRRMRTAMAIFDDEAAAIARGHVEGD